EIERWVDLRIERQRVFERAEPLHMSAVIDEAALRRQMGGPDILAEQLRHLIESVEQPHIEIRILPFTAGAHASPGGPFTLLKMSDPFPEVAHVESPAGSIYLETDAVDGLIDTYDWLHEHSLNNEDSTAFLMGIAK